MKRLWLGCVLAVSSPVWSALDGIRFEPRAEYQLVDIETGSYAEYRAEVEAILRRNWQELYRSDEDLPNSSALAEHDEFTPEELVSLHTPTDRPADCTPDSGRPRGMLLIHGLYDSPYVMKDLEDYFHRRCFHTRSILLPGHGTRPGNLLDIKYTAWVRTVDRAIRQFRADLGEDIYISGFSTGGALALNAALDHEAIQGLFLFAPALQLGAWHARMLNGLMIDWVPSQKFDDRDLVKYESLTLNSVVEVARLADSVREKLAEHKPGLSIPVLLVLARNDYTVKSGAAIRLFEEGWFGRQSEMLVFTPLEPGDDRSPAGGLLASPGAVTYLDSSFIHESNGEQYLIADYSHMSLLLKPTDPHYGLEGAYRYCLQYFLDDDARERCETRGSTLADICFGERVAVGSASYPQCEDRGLTVRRLTSNPRFDAMTEQIDRFIEDRLDTGG